MIPKIVHYCWLSGEPVPNNLLKYMKSWEEKLSDWEFILWDKSRFDINSVEWVRQAYEAKKYAFAADYIRQYAVYHFGGFYMDMDIEVVKNLDNLLERRYVLGAETVYGVEAGVFGAEKGSPIIKECLEWYNNRKFIDEKGELNMRGCPLVMMEAISRKFDIRITSKYIEDERIVCLLPRDFLTAKSSETGIVTKTVNTLTVHHFAGSWLRNTHLSRLKYRLKMLLGGLFGERFIKSVNNIMHPESYKNTAHRK